MLLKLETAVCVLIFRLNLFSTMYTVLNFIRLGGCFINNKVVMYPYLFLNKGDILSINIKFFKKVFNIFFFRLFLSKSNLKKNKKFRRKRYLISATKIFVNCPDYIEANYKILSFCLWRLPKRSEIVTPYDFPFSFSTD
jgi:ribosomal protein S4